MSVDRIETMGKKEGDPLVSMCLSPARGGEVRLYLPLERCIDVGQLKASGYDVADESGAL